MSDVRAGMIIAGKYRIEAPLARGGMGSVWRARHLTLETPLAVKFIGADVIALVEARRRFQREARAAALLHSPHVVQIHDYGVDGEHPLPGHGAAPRRRSRASASSAVTGSRSTRR